MIAADDHLHMARALRLAARGLFTTDPNPRVGCVLVKRGQVIGEGWHARAGGPHAERVALAAAGEEAVGATAYVTLEPCAHQGRTGPCSGALVAARVARVVCAGVDPNPAVAGKGLAMLREAGIAVEIGPLEAAAEALNPGYFSRRRRARPWVRSKLAVTLDGRTALADGSSQWITGPAARRDVHLWRARSSAILTGAGTVAADDPRLTARLDDNRPVLQPLRVVLDARLRTAPEARVVNGPTGALILTTEHESGSRRRAALERAGARVETLAGDARCDLGALMSRLNALEINEVWVEAGPTLNGALLEADLIDELVIYVAARIVGDSGRAMFGLPALASLDVSKRFVFGPVRKVGDDLRIMARLITVAGP
jgi:diaminohydroxyphosphoribosylaminopyrimidine deaminase/5-amino-6-(5-phosphoribosylamino)uracil reductase